MNESVTCCFGMLRGAASGVEHIRVGDEDFVFVFGHNGYAWKSVQVCGSGRESMRVSWDQEARLDCVDSRLAWVFLSKTTTRHPGGSVLTSS